MSVPKKLVVYSRVSTDHQGKGLEAQQRALRDYIVYKKIPADQVLEFCDDGVSGMKISRPGFDKMMAAVRAGNVHTVLVYSYSRFARNTLHLISTLEEFGKLGVAFVSLSENIDTTTPGGRLVFIIFAGLAQFEREQISQRVVLGLKNARAKGKTLGRPAKAKGKAAEIVALHAQGVPVDEIARSVGVSQRSVYRAIARNPSK